MIAALENLEEVFEDAAAEAVKDAVENFDFEDAIKEALGEYNLDRAAEAAVEDAIEATRLDRTIEEEVDKAINLADIDDQAEKAVEEVLERELPGKVREVFLGLLKDTEFLEMLSEALFERWTPGS